MELSMKNIFSYTSNTHFFSWWTGGFWRSQYRMHCFLPDQLVKESDCRTIFYSKWWGYSQGICVHWRNLIEIVWWLWLRQPNDSWLGLLNDIRSRETNVQSWEQFIDSMIMTQWSWLDHDSMMMTWSWLNDDDGSLTYWSLTQWWWLDHDNSSMTRWW